MDRRRTPIALQQLTSDAWLLFATRFIRLFAYGSLSVVLVFYLVGLGLSEPQTGLLLTLDARRRHARLAVPHHPRRSDRPPADADRRRGADGGGRVWSSRRRDNSWLLLLAGNDRRHQPERARSRAVPVDRAGRALARRHRSDEDRACSPGTRWPGSLATALGALAGGTAHARCLQQTTMPPVEQLSRGRDSLRRARRAAGGACSRACRAPPKRRRSARRRRFERRSPASPDSSDRATS